ncbi:PEP/pyruvate-binding domain-containing protein [Cellulomonas shaoxiangyii]|uniref:PEP/pyruvate-binding domain-containing protein n=1 Tax=Cellulomonas shaoxiangyii TaxID=2566013 RepID=UPI002449C017|nr:PEP/pyruvate-binding domain-containing protein [Cellulomonas shaoxiangyii]
MRRTCGGKAGALGALVRAGLPVPAGVVVPFAAYLAAGGDRAPGGRTAERRDADTAAVAARPLPSDVRDALARGLDTLGDPVVAVRSSAGDEDTARASAAGQHATVLAVRGVDQVADAVRACWASLHSARAVSYRAASAADPDAGRDDGPGPGPDDVPVMAVLVQRLVDADVSGVMFTPGGPADATEIEASWGLGPSVVGGTVTPDAYRVTADGTVTRSLADKPTRMDRRDGRLVTSDVLAPDRRRPTLDDTTAARLAALGARIAAVLGGAQDVEWALAGGELWVLQARPVTADLPGPRPGPRQGPRAAGAPATLTGTPGSRGTATGAARIVRGPADFGRVRAGDVLVCPWTDPAWTPLLGVAAGVVTETGGVLSHAAIVARERGIPAVLGVRGATTTLRDGATLTVDGTAGTVTAVHP